MAHSSNAPPDQKDDTGSSASSPDVISGSRGSTSRGGPGNWGVAARWFMFAILAIAFVVTLYVVF